MEFPYTPLPNDAFFAAHGAVGVALSAYVWHRPMRPIAGSIAMVGAIALAVLAPMAETLGSFIGFVVQPNAYFTVLKVAAALATVAMALARPRWLAAIAFVGQFALAWASNHLKDVDQAFSSLHILWFSVLFALHLRINHADERPRESVANVRAHPKDDLLIFAGSTLIALAVAYFVVELTCDSADEWGYNWTALSLAHFKAWLPIPECPAAHRAHWVFFYKGKAFSQYLPGWPMALAPFARAGVPWLAAPVCFGAMAVGTARLARRARGRIAGIIAAVVAVLGATMLLNAGSRYSHAFGAAVIVWSIEAVCALTDRGLSTRAQWGWGLVLGLTTSLSICSRPSDGAIYGLPVFLYFVYAIVKRRIGWRGFLGTSFAFSLIAGLTLVILHAQLGVWFKTGYNIAKEFYPWAEMEFSLPGRDAWKWAIPLGTFAYCYWPTAPALGVPGLIMLGRRQAFMWGLATVGHLTFYGLCQFGRYRDFGFGPRYYLNLVLPCAIGMGVMLAPLWDALRKRRWLPGGNWGAAPAAVIFATLVVGLLRIYPTIFPDAHAQMHRRSGLRRAIAKSGIHHAAVTVREGETGGSQLLDTQNDPTNLQGVDVLVLSPDDLECSRRLYKDRVFYRATGFDEVVLTPYE